MRVTVLEKCCAYFVGFLPILIIILLIIFGDFSAQKIEYSFNTDISKAGFFTGFWHGCISLFSLIISIFKKNVAVYAIYNTGVWYDFGFLIGIAGVSHIGGLWQKLLIYLSEKWVLSQRT